MNKIIVMKRNILFLSLVGILFLTASCVQPDIDSQIKLQPESGPALFTATIENSQTKVQLNEDETGKIHVLWSPSDKITLFYGGGATGSVFKSTNTEPSATVEFTGTLPDVVGEITDSHFYAVYPSHGVNNDQFLNGQLDIQVNQSQIYPNPGSFSYKQGVAGTGAVFVGKSETHDIKFYNVCSFFRFKVTRDDVIRVDFEGKDNEKICGGFSVQFNATTGLPEVVVPEEANSAGGKSGAVSLRFTNAYTQCFEPGLWYYLTLLPTTFTHGATVTVYTKTGKVTRSIAGPITFAQNQYRSIASIDTGITFDDNFTTDLTLNGSSVSATTLWPHGTATFVPVVNVILPEGNHVIPDITWTWSSDHPEVAKVSNKGVVTGVAAGTAEITATTTLNGTSHSLSCTVTVTEADSQLAEKPFTVDENGTKVYFAYGNLYTTGSPNRGSNNGYTLENLSFNNYQGKMVSVSRATWNYSGACDKFRWYEIANSNDTPKLFEINGLSWQTPSNDFWAYLLSSRSATEINGVSNARFAKASVNGIHGLLLFPDEYEHPASVPTPTVINVGSGDFTDNCYDGADWVAMEQKGVVFLPAAGYQNSNNDWYVGSLGYYWSCTSKTNNDNNIYGIRLLFSYKTTGNVDNRVVTGGTNDRGSYYSVRLVRFVTE